MTYRLGWVLYCLALAGMWANSGDAAPPKKGNPYELSQAEKDEVIDRSDAFILVVVNMLPKNCAISFAKSLNAVGSLMGSRVLSTIE